MVAGDVRKALQGVKWSKFHRLFEARFPYVQALARNVPTPTHVQRLCPRRSCRGLKRRCPAKDFCGWGQIA